MRSSDHRAVRVAPAAWTDQPIIATMMQHYLVESAVFVPGSTTSPESYPYLEFYWREPERCPFLFCRGEDAIGFALVNTWAPSGGDIDYAMAEFYVRPAFRRKGVGVAAATAIIDARPGRWEIGVSANNRVALTFWRHVAAKLSAVRPTELIGDGARWNGRILSFSIAPPHGR